MLKIRNSLLVAAFTAMLGCSDSTEVNVIDLNKVLDVMIETLDQMPAVTGANAVTPVSDTGFIKTALNDGSSESPAVDEATKEKYMQEFNARYTENLNKAQFYPQPLATEVKNDGSFSGFVDANQNLAHDSGEPQIFTVEIDAERSRLIATDTTYGYRRDGGFSMSGLAAGLLVGHLLSRQSAAGVNTSKFKNMQMSPKNYHAGAVASARAKAGSGSFKSGK
jgi:hypothetical protein